MDSMLFTCTDDAEKGLNKEAIPNLRRETAAWMAADCPLPPPDSLVKAHIEFTHHSKQRTLEFLNRIASKTSSAHSK